MNHLRNHILGICRRHRIRVVWCDHYPHAYWSLPEIHIYPVTSWRAYATALHELGHCFTSRYLRHRGEYAREVAAWRWAKRNALVWNSHLEGGCFSALFCWRRFLAHQRKFCEYVNRYR